ncbi:cytochrome P450 [Fusarium oxysporum f. sp. albedinis]|nr:cytochrome P450 [Fusarium oxysporum f. sp. albedinis]
MALLLIGVLLAVWLVKLFQRAYLTPLRRVPGPFHAKFTHLWLKKHVLGGSRIYYVHNLHVKYGPVGEWYQSFRKGGQHQDLFSMVNSKTHAQRKKLFALLFSNTALMNNWFPIKEEAKQTGEVDIFKWWTFMAADVISHLAFGEPFGVLSHGKTTELMQSIEVAAKFGLISSELPQLSSLLRCIPVAAIQKAANSDAQLQRQAESMMKQARANGIGATNIFSKLVAEHEKDSEQLTDYEVALEAGSFIVAGTGTTAVTLSYLVYAVLSDPVEALPYLSAVIEETLRKYSAAPGALPRTVPKGGVTLAGHFIPQGTTVSTQAYTFHRDIDTYPNPESFIPERFLSPSGEFEQPKGVFLPFGAGSRTCLGVHLARMELRHAATLFFRECKGARLSPWTTPESMEMVNYFLVTPKSGQCWVTLGYPSP